MILEALSALILGGKVIKEKIDDKKPYNHVFNRPEDVENRRKAQELYDQIRKEYEERTGKKANW